MSRRRPVQRAGRVVAAGAIGLLAAGCLPNGVTAEGRDIGTLYLGVNIVAAAVGVFVAVLITFSVLRFRHRAASDELPAQTRGNLGLEIVWTVIPTVIVAGLFVATVAVLTRVDSTEATPGAELDVTAFRWGWTFEYPGEDVAVSGIGVPGPVVVVPVDEPVRMTLRSSDVIHSLMIPQFLFKRDVNPGHVNVIQFTVEEPGDYGGQCAEFCGIYHSQMPFTLRAVDRAEYDAWLAEQRAAAAVEPASERP